MSSTDKPPNESRSEEIASHASSTQQLLLPQQQPQPQHRPPSAGSAPETPISRSFTSHSFGSTRGSGLDLISSRASSVVNVALLLKKRQSGRGDLVHMRGTARSKGSRSSGVSSGSDGDDGGGAPDHRSILSLKSTANVTGVELEEIVSMGEAAYVDLKVTHTVNQFRRILHTPRGRVALKSQQYLHEMTNETLGAKRRLMCVFSFGHW